MQMRVEHRFDAICNEFFVGYSLKPLLYYHTLLIKSSKYNQNYGRNNTGFRIKISQKYVNMAKKSLFFA